MHQSIQQSIQQSTFIELEKSQALPLRIEVFIRQRIADLGLTEEAFILKLGMRHFKRKQRKLHHLFNANWTLAEKLIPFLSAALDVSQSTIDYIITQTKTDIAYVNDVLRRQNFSQVAFFITKNALPSSITMAALTGTTRYIDLQHIHEQKFINYVLMYIQQYPKRLVLLNGFYGGVTGFSIAYTPDLFLNFDLQGNFIDTQVSSTLPGYCTVKIH